MTPSLSKETISETQHYLDSLSYLIEFTIDEELKDNQLSWKEFLDKELSQRLSESNVNSIDEMTEQVEYFSLGDTTLRRICYLINVYYDYPLYA